MTDTMASSTTAPALPLVGSDDMPVNMPEGSKRGDDEADEVEVAPQAGSDIKMSNFLSDATALFNEPSEVSLAADSGGVQAFSAGAQNYAIVWKGSPNFWQGRTATHAIVNHIMQSSLGSATSWFANPQAEASSHFGIGLGGQIYQYVRTENSAWANGPVGNPDQSVGWLMDAIAKKINPNKVTISIEHEGFSGKPMPEEQFQATLWLHKQLIAQYGIPVDRQHIIGHYQIDKINRPNCPGTGFPWDRLMNELKAMTPPPPPAAPESDGDGVAGFVPQVFGPGTVKSNNSFVRARPSFGSDGAVQRKLMAGTLIRFVGYTDSGPAYQGGTRWYRISNQDGGGWIHSQMIG